MLSHPWRGVSQSQRRLVNAIRRWWPESVLLARRGSVALEFALIAVPFLTLTLFVMELSYDLFTQEVMDSALYLAARQIQTGNAQNSLSGNDFIANYMAPNLSGLLSASNVYVQVRVISPTSSQDYYDFTSGTLPMSNGALDLTGFGSGSFCNAGPAKLLLVSSIYVGPTIVGFLLPNVISEYFNGSLVHATLSTIGVASEAFHPSAAAAGSAAAC